MATEIPPETPQGVIMPIHRRIGGIVAKIDRFGIDGLINACGFVVFAAAEGLRTLQNGKVQVALLVAMAVLVATVIAAMLGLPNLITGAGGSHL